MSEENNINKKEEARFRVIVVICAVIILSAVVGILAVRGDFVKFKDGITTTGTTLPPTTIDQEKVERDALFMEHEALFTEYRKVFWLGEYENYKTLVPLFVWEKMAKDAGVSVAEIYTATENDLAQRPVNANDAIRFYIADIEVADEAKAKSIKDVFSKMYEMDATVIEEVYLLDVQVVEIKDGERVTTEDTYYSLKINGMRYLATDAGFVG